MSAPEQNVQQTESWLIGQILAKPEKLMDLKITVDHFTIESHRRMFDKITELESQNKIIDVITVADALEKEFPNQDYWLSNLGQYQMDSFSESFFESSQMIMIESYRNRKIKDIALQLDQDFDADKAIKHLMDLNHTEKKYTHSMPEAAMAAIEHAEETAKKNGVTGLSTGLENLDNALGGFQDPDLIIIGARPSMGKTSLALNFMLNHKAPVAFFSTEQPFEQIGLRAISAESSVSARKIRVASFEEQEMNRMYAAVTKLTESKIQIYDKGSLTITELTREARRLKYNQGIEAVYVDYIQRMKIEGKDRREGLGDIVRGMKSLAKELKIPVIALAQVNREVEKRQDKRPRMGDLKDSGDIEQEADEIILIYRDEVYNPDTPEKGIIELLIDKNRHGPTGVLRNAWLPDTMQIKDLYTHNVVNFS